jgi:AP2 domain.
MRKPDFTHAELVERLSYDPETGEFRWRPNPAMNATWNSRFAGAKAGTMAAGRLSIRLNYRRYFAHRLAWFYMTGEWPEYEIDHANCDPSDNRFSNLRLASRGQNAANIRTPRHNTSGRKGVTWDRTSGKWLAFAWTGGRFRNLGRYDTKEEASGAYMRHMAGLYGPYARAA